MRFEYLQPATTEEAISLLSQHNGKARLIAGGTDLVTQMKQKQFIPQFVIDITRIPGLDYIRYDDKQGLRIGTLTPIRSLELSAELQKRYPAISRAAGQLGSMAIRNVATIGGNLCNAAPSAETAPSLIASGAKARIAGPDGEIVVPIEEFFTGPGSTVLKTGELLVEIQAPVPPPQTRGVYLKHGIRGTVDLAIVGVAVVITLNAKGELCQDVNIALGAVAPTPIRARNAEQLIRGKKIDDSLIAKCAQAASEESRPISDVRASAQYRKEMVEVFTRRALREALAG